LPRANHLSLPAYTLIFLLLLPSVFWGQEVSESPARLVIPDGTPVKLQMVRTISSERAKKDDRLDFVVVKDVTVGGFTIIQAGTIATGSVVGVKGRRLLGIGGNVVIKLDSVELITGDEVALRARKEIKGSSRTKFMVVEMIATGLLYLPAAPAFLISRGRDSTVLKGTEVTAYIDGDSPVQTAKLLGAKEGVSELREMIKFLPPRTVDGEGREGDMLNLIFIAKKEDLEAAFGRAGWVKTEKSRPAIFWHLLRQTYSYALPDPASIVARRHHLRIWKTDYQMDGTPIWVGAATHDVSIQIAIKKFRIFHRIDPQVDAERDFIAGNLADTRLVTNEEYLHCVDPVFKGQTTTGGTYYSDSRMLLVDLHQLKSDNFARQPDTSNLKVNIGGGAVLINASR
jgi:LssY C-terminus